MIKFTAGANGRKVLGLGLSFANLRTLREKHGDTMIQIDGRELGLDFDVIIFSGPTEQQMTRLIADKIGPETKVTIDPRMTDG